MPQSRSVPVRSRAPAPPPKRGAPSPLAPTPAQLERQQWYREIGLAIPGKWSQAQQVALARAWANSEEIFSRSCRANLESASYEVRGSGGAWYTTNADECDCPGFRHAVGHWCKHRVWAWRRDGRPIAGQGLPQHGNPPPVLTLAEARARAAADVLEQQRADAQDGGASYRAFSAALAGPEPEPWQGDPSEPPEPDPSDEPPTTDGPGTVALTDLF